jgi:hypothetical protein
MSRSARSPSRPSLSLRDAAWHKCAFLVVVLALGLAGASLPLASVVAAPSAAERVYELKVLAIQTPGHPAICAGFTYPIRVQLQQYTVETLSDGEEIVADLPRGVSATIQGVSTDPGVGTLSPDSKDTGLSAANSLPDLVVFSFSALKPGQTTLVFNGTALDGTVAGDSLAVEVETCKYRVSMTAFSVALGGGVKIWTAGHMQTEIGDDGAGGYTGSGSLIFNSGFIGPPCTIQYSLFDAPTIITGPGIENDQLTLKFAFEPGSLTNTVSCPVGGGTGSHTIDLTNLHIPPTKFPAAGGTVAHRLWYEGSDAGDTTVIINVELITI